MGKISSYPAMTALQGSELILGDQSGATGTTTPTAVAAYMAGLTTTPVIASYARTSAEISAGVTPTNYAYPPEDVRRYGAHADGVTDDLPAFNQAFLVAQQSGGVVTLDPGASYAITSGNLLIPAGATLDGGVRYLGSLLNNTATDIGALTGILLNSSYSIVLNGGSAVVRGLCIKPYGMAFPLSSTELANNVFVGTAIIGYYDDCKISDCAIFGFSTAVHFTYPSGSTIGAQRPRIERLNFDCLTGVQIDNCYDIATISQCHGWPWATINSTNSSEYTNERSGTGYFLNGTDWPVLESCFCIGFAIGFHVSGRGHTRLIGCGSDGAVSMAQTVNRVSLQIDTGAEYVAATDCVFASAYNAVVLNVAEGTPVYWSYLNNCRIINFVNYGIYNQDGFITVSQCGIIGQSGDAAAGVWASLAQCRTRIRNCDFEQCTLLFGASVACTSDMYEISDVWWDTTGSAVAPYNNISLNYLTPSSEVLSLPLNGSSYLVTLAGDITTVQGGFPGREITFVNNSTNTVTWVFSNNLLLNGGVNFAQGPNSTLTLLCLANGIWIEKARS